MAQKKTLQQFILMPVRGLTVQGPALSGSLHGFFTSMSVGASPKLPNVEMKVLDSVHENGAKLVQMSSDSAIALRAHQPGMRLVPLVYYYPAISPRFKVQSKIKPSATTKGLKIKLRLVSKTDGRPVVGAQVVAFTDFTNRIGAEGTSNSKGEVALELGALTKKVERFYVYPGKSFWSLLKKNLVISSALKIGLQPVDLSYTDALRHFYGNVEDDSGSGVKVAVIDSGINLSHPDLLVDGGMCTVVGEAENDFGDVGNSHGTHVAGIIAARGKPSTGLRGLAPAVKLRSYRVFGKNSEGASNYSIIKAIDRAVADRCDLINMSLGGGTPDDATRAAIEDARAGGALVIVASGNDGRKPVNFPASDAMAIAVSATGRIGTFPKESTASDEVIAPYGKDKKNFVAAFSNIGPEIDVTGAGVDILSTVPGGYAPMSGTSMACPAVTGITARLLAKRADILSMAWDQARSDAIAQLLLQSANPLGFGAAFEGQGML